MRARFLKPARRELTDAIRYDDTQRAGLGAEFREEARATVRRTKSFPWAWHCMGGSIRRCQLRRFPYGIIYEPGDEVILVIAIAHLHQEAGDWRTRLA